jgi:hypothetical protein
MVVPWVSESHVVVAFLKKQQEPIPSLFFNVCFVWGVATNPLKRLKLWINCTARVYARDLF